MVEVGRCKCVGEKFGGWGPTFMYHLVCIVVWPGANPNCLPGLNPYFLQIAHSYSLVIHHPSLIPNQRWSKILIMVSHSQDFMNNVCTRTIHFNHHTKKLDYYGGNYDNYVITRREVADAQMKIYKREQEQIAHMKSYIARFGHGA